MQKWCDFESDDLCGWTHDRNHDFDWRRHNFATPSGHVGTGPAFDHTVGPGHDGKIFKCTYGNYYLELCKPYLFNIETIVILYLYFSVTLDCTTAYSKLMLNQSFLCLCNNKNCF